MVQLSPRDLDAWLRDDSRDRPQVLDVREPWEYEVCRIEPSRLMPMRAVPLHFEQLDPDAETVVVCHHGVRSFQVGMFLERQGFAKVFNLTGGVAAWQRDVDPEMPTY